MSKITTVTIYENWDEQSNAVLAAKQANDDLNSSEFVSIATFHGGIHDGNFLVIAYELNGSNVNETRKVSEASRFHSVSTTPTVFFVEIDEQNEKFDKILSQVNGNNITVANLKKEYNRLLFNRQNIPTGEGGEAGGGGLSYGLSILDFPLPETIRRIYEKIKEILGGFALPFTAVIIFLTVFLIYKIVRK
jgi:hypothetical protein